MSIATNADNRTWNIRSVQVASPAAANDWSVTVPAGEEWKVKCIHALYTASATVATREPRFQIKDDAGNVMFLVASDATLAASNTADCTVFPGASQSGNATANKILYGLPPDLVLPGSWTISSSTLNISAGDQWSQINLVVEQHDAL